MGTEAVCRNCRQIVRVDAAGNVLSHRRADHSPFQCYASGKPGSEVTTKRGVGGPRLNRAERFTLPPQTLLAPPKWLPAWRDDHIASLALPADGPLGVWLPQHTSWQQQQRIGDYMPTSTPPLWQEQRGCWTVPNQHFLRIAGELMARSSRIMVGREYNPREACTSSCKSARGPLCTCSCRARYHGRGRWRRGWTTLAEFDTRHEMRSWHWIVVTKAN